MKRDAKKIACRYDETKAKWHAHRAELNELTGEIAGTPAMTIEGVKMIDRIRVAALVAVEFLVFDKDELIARAAADYETLGPVLMALADAADTLKGLREIVTAAELRLAIALANVEGNSAAAA